MFQSFIECKPIRKTSIIPYEFNKKCNINYVVFIDYKFMGSSLSSFVVRFLVLSRAVHCVSTCEEGDLH
ncbi:hypothetical protein HanIR_Chr02g0097841 [Helianthus annuus]|nr:hypothetical protein HanIR_Chr02g0097841 [Helianthus annuus]